MIAMSKQKSLSVEKKWYRDIGYLSEGTLKDIRISAGNTYLQLLPGVEIYILLGLHVQPQLQKVQPQCMRVQPQLGRGPYAGLGWSAVSLRGRSSDLKRPTVGLRGPCASAGALCRPERALCRLVRAIFRSKMALFSIRGPCVVLKGNCLGLRRALSGQQKDLSGRQRPFFRLKGSPSAWEGLVLTWEALC